MAKNTFAARTFKAATFKSGTWTGVGVTPPPPLPTPAVAIPGLLGSTGAKGGYTIAPEWLDPSGAHPPPPLPVDGPYRWRSRTIMTHVGLSASNGLAVFVPATKPAPQPVYFFAEPMGWVLKTAADAGRGEAVLNYAAAAQEGVVGKMMADAGGGRYHDERPARDKRDVAMMLAMEFGEPWLADELEKLL